MGGGVGKGFGGVSERRPNGRRQPRLLRIPRAHAFYSGRAGRSILADSHPLFVSAHGSTCGQPPLPPLPYPLPHYTLTSGVSCIPDASIALATAFTLAASNTDTCSSRALCANALPTEERGTEPLLGVDTCTKEKAPTGKAQTGLCGREGGRASSPSVHRPYSWENWNSEYRKRGVGGGVGGVYGRGIDFGDLGWGLGIGFGGGGGCGRERAGVVASHWRFFMGPTPKGPTRGGIPVMGAAGRDG